MSQIFGPRNHTICQKEIIASHVLEKGIRGYSVLGHENLGREKTNPIMWPARQQNQIPT
jgi:hypothetical protein